MHTHAPYVVRIPGRIHSRHQTEAAAQDTADALSEHLKLDARVHRERAQSFLKRHGEDIVFYLLIAVYLVTSIISTLMFLDLIRTS